ncbi:pyridoxal phosphate-dependent transferase [Echria macrotheca]|uniref:aromatic-amino-acid transaminase n=1 Tax=Echria macrotheca TaxID=438768 RepID=A0AAJ0B629_9PEZI|nr:pyridoxal phosphate-dependent transferase [Echria macrotheca]
MRRAVTAGIGAHGRARGAVARSVGVVVSLRTFHSKPADGYSEALGTAAKTTDVPAGQVAAEPAPPFGESRVSMADVAARRAKAGRLIAGAAAYSDTDMFKGPSAGKPRARRFDHHLSAESAIREPCVLKQAAKHLKKPGLISLGGGLPCAENFPIASLSMHIPLAPHFSEEATVRNGVDVTVGKYDAAAGIAEYDLATALNYGQANGSPQMNRFVAEHTEIAHNPPYADWRSCLTVGSTAALEQALRMLCDRARGDAIITEEYSFSTAVETAMPLGVKVFGVEMDGEGLLPESMDELLTTWDETARGARKPHVLYTVPSGQNPTGATQGERRRRDIYAVASKHDIYILEDEPYYFLQMPPYRRGQSVVAKPDENVDDFLAGLVPSLLSMDVDGRVMRMDSFSKVVVPGSRLGWVTASEQMIERYIRHAEVCNQGPSGFSQVLMHKLLDEQWGHEGYFRWLMHLRGEYTRRRNALLDACEDFLPREVTSWQAPMAGMFHWIKVDHTQHPLFTSPSAMVRTGDPGARILQIEEAIFEKCIANGVLVGRGSWFRAEHGRPPRGLFFRTTFAAATPENMREAISRFGAAVREVYGMN